MDSSQPRLYSLNDAAAILGKVSHWKLRKHIYAGHIRATKLGTRVFIDGQELDRIVREGLPSL